MRDGREGVDGQSLGILRRNGDGRCGGGRLDGGRMLGNDAAVGHDEDGILHTTRREGISSVGDVVLHSWAVVGGPNGHAIDGGC